MTCRRERASRRAENLMLNAGLIALIVSLPSTVAFMLQPIASQHGSTSRCAPQTHPTLSIVALSLQGCMPLRMQRATALQMTMSSSSEADSRENMVRVRVCVCVRARARVCVCVCVCVCR